MSTPSGRPNYTSHTIRTAVRSALQRRLHRSNRTTMWHPTDFNVVRMLNEPLSPARYGESVIYQLRRSQFVPAASDVDMSGLRASVHLSHF